MLTLNNFVLNCISCLQTKYFAMRIICPSPYAIIFMKEFQTKYIYPSIKHISITYFCDIDDIFLIRTGNSWETSNTFDDLINIKRLTPTILCQKINKAFEKAWQWTQSPKSFQGVCWNRLQNKWNRWRKQMFSKEKSSLTRERTQRMKKELC